MSAAIIEPVAPQNRLRALADIRNEAPINDAARDEYNDRAYAAVRDLNRRLSDATVKALSGNLAELEFLMRQAFAEGTDHGLVLASDIMAGVRR